MKLLHDIARWSGEAPGYNKGGSTTTAALDPDIKKAVLPVIKDVSTDEFREGLGTVAGTTGVEGALDRGQNTSDQLAQVGRDQLNLGADIANQEGRFGYGVDTAKSQYEDQIAGRGAFDNTAAIQRDLGNLKGNLEGQAAASGSLTSARQQAATQGALADRSLQHNQLRQQNIQQGLQGQQGLRSEASGAATTGLQYQTQAGQNIAGADEANLRAEQARRALDQEAIDAPYQAASRYFGLLKGAPQGQTQTTKGGGK